MTKKCLMCGNDLPRDSSSRRKYCDDKCRLRYNRAHSPQALYNQAMQNINRIGRLPTSDRLKALKMLRELKREVDYQLLLLKDHDTVQKNEMLNGRKPKYNQALIDIDPIHYD